LDNELGFADIMLKELMSAALNSGYDVILCQDPMCLKKAEHLLVPELSLGFVSGDAKRCGDSEIYRHIRLDAMANADELARQRHDIRGAKKQTQSLMKSAYESLRHAKNAHDELEAKYNPHVNFDGVYALADTYIMRLFGDKSGK